MIPNGALLEIHFRNGQVRQLNTDVKTADLVVRWVMESRAIIDNNQNPGGQTMLPDPGFPAEVMHIPGWALPEIMDVKYTLSDGNTVQLGRPLLEAAAPMLPTILRQLEGQPSLKPLADLLNALHQIMEPET